MNAYSLARALSGNLTYREEETGLDRLAALAMGSIGPAADSLLADEFGDPVRKASRESHLNSLGTSLIAFKHAHRADYYLRAVRELGVALAWRKVRNRGAVSKQSISEWCVDQCNACYGAKSIFDTNGVMRPCVVCGQTGKRKYHDEERKGIPGKAMSEAHSLISLAVSVAIRGASRRLK